MNPASKACCKHLAGGEGGSQRARVAVARVPPARELCWPRAAKPGPAFSPACCAPASQMPPSGTGGRGQLLPQGSHIRRVSDEIGSPGLASRRLPGLPPLHGTRSALRQGKGLEGNVCRGGRTRLQPSSAGSGSARLRNSETMRLKLTGESELSSRAAPRGTQGSRPARTLRPEQESPWLSCSSFHPGMATVTHPKPPFRKPPPGTPQPRPTAVLRVPGKASPKLQVRPSVPAHTHPSLPSPLSPQGPDSVELGCPTASSERGIVVRMKR